MNRIVVNAVSSIYLNYISYLYMVLSPFIGLKGTQN